MEIIISVLDAISAVIVAVTGAILSNKNKYTYHRDKLLIVGSEEVVRCILKYENEAVGKETNLHDEFLTDIVKEIGRDLKIKGKNYPQIYLKK